MHVLCQMQTRNMQKGWPMHQVRLQVVEALLLHMLKVMLARRRSALQRGLHIRIVILLHLSTIKHILNKCDCFIVRVC